MTNETYKQAMKEVIEGLAFLSFLETVEEILDEMIADVEQEEERVYATGFYTSHDQRLLEDVIALSDMRRNFGDDHPLYQTLVKATADVVRENLGIKNVISLGADLKKGLVLVFEYDVESTGDDFYKIGLDEETNIPYLIV